MSPPEAPALKRVHDLKCWLVYYDAIVDGRKTFEARLNDRDYRFGDMLRLHRWDPEASCYTGEVCEREVTYVLCGPAFGIEDGYCVMGFRDPDVKGCTTDAPGAYAVEDEEDCAATRFVSEDGSPDCWGDKHYPPCRKAPR